MECLTPTAKKAFADSSPTVTLLETRSGTTEASPGITFDTNCCEITTLENKIKKMNYSKHTATMTTGQIANTVVPVTGAYTIRPQDPAVRLERQQHQQVSLLIHAELLFCLLSRQARQLLVLSSSSRSNASVADPSQMNRAGDATSRRERKVKGHELKTLTPENSVWNKATAVLCFYFHSVKDSRCL